MDYWRRSICWGDMAEVLSDEILEKFVPRGTYPEIANILRQKYAALTQRITFPMPEDPANDRLAAEAIAQLKS